MLDAEVYPTPARLTTGDGPLGELLTERPFLRTFCRCQCWQTALVIFTSQARSRLSSRTSTVENNLTH